MTQATPRVVATVLTHNRRELLSRCLDAVRAQTRPADRVIVVDNASSDGTREMLASDFPEVEVVALPQNLGGAGGYYEAIAAAKRTDAGWYWLMDDDSIATPAALEELLAALDRIEGGDDPALLCSRVEWTDGNPHPMNRPSPRRRDQRDVVSAVSRRLLPVRAATFVSVLLARDAVEHAGMPARHYFFQADDIEYTARVLRDARGYYVPDSVVVHATPAQHTAVDDDRRFFYHARNTVLMLRGRAWRPREKPVLAFWLASTSVTYLRINRMSPRAVRNLLRALWSGLRSPVL